LTPNSIFKEQQKKLITKRYLKIEHGHLFCEKHSYRNTYSASNMIVLRNR